MVSPRAAETEQHSRYIFEALAGTRKCVSVRSVEARPDVEPMFLYRKDKFIVGYRVRVMVVDEVQVLRVVHDGLTSPAETVVGGDDETNTPVRTTKCAEGSS